MLYNINMASLIPKSQYLNEETASSLADYLGPISWKKNAAEKKIRERSSELIVPLLQEFHSRLCIIGKINKFTSSIPTILIAACIMYTIINFRIVDTVEIGSLYPLLIVFFILPMLSTNPNSGMQIINFATLIAKFDDLRIIGSLAEILCKNFAYSYVANYKLTNIKSTLRENLVLIKSENDVELTSNQIACLVKLLKHRSDRLKLAILHALPFVGNKSCLNYVHKLANQEIYNTSFAVVEAAEKCLPALEARVARLNTAETLLRASSPEVKNDTLLIPTLEIPEIRSEELLSSSQK